MADDQPVFKETTNRNEQRRNPRFPGSAVWSEEQRREHREQRDSLIEDAGLVTDRVIESGEDGSKA